MKFRELRANEIEARVATVSDKGCSILLYKNARCDMNILDETVGEMNWQRDHKEIKGNMYAGIGIWDAFKKIWVWKWDCGTESYTEGEKGEASDSFKRAGFNWGIGRELYTAPFIWMKADQINLADKNGKKTTYDSFKVEDIEYKDGKISYLKVVDNKTKAIFLYGKSRALKDENIKDLISEEEFQIITELIRKANVNEQKLLSQYKIESFITLTKVQYTALKTKLEEAVAKKEA